MRGSSPTSSAPQKQGVFVCKACSLVSMWTMDLVNKARICSRPLSARRPPGGLGTPREGVYPQLSCPTRTLLTPPEGQQVRTGGRPSIPQGTASCSTTTPPTAETLCEGDTPPPSPVPGWPGLCQPEWRDGGFAAETRPCGAGRAGGCPRDTCTDVSDQMTASVHGKRALVPSHKQPPAT